MKAPVVISDRLVRIARDVRAGLEPADLAGRHGLSVEEARQLLRALARPAELTPTPAPRTILSDEAPAPAFHDLVVGLFRCDPLGTLTDVNPAFARMLGAEGPEELIGATLTGRFVEDAQAHDWLERVRNEGFVRDFPVTLSREGDPPLHGRLHARVQLGRRYELAAIEGALMEWGEAAASTAPSRAERRYRQFFQLSNDAVLIHDLDGRIESVNERACEMLGRTAVMLTGMTLRDLQPEESFTPHLRALATLRQKGSVRFETRFTCPDGRELVAEISSSVIEAEAQVVQSIVRDVTARKHAEAALRRTNETLRALVEGSPAGIAILDRRGRVTLWNPAAARMFALTQQAALGRFCPACSPDEPERTSQLLREVMERGTAQHDVDLACCRTDGETVHINLSAAPLHGAREEIIGCVLVMLDVTERVKLDDERRRMQARVQEARRSESLGVLTGGIAHDFNNLLMGVMGNASLALMDLPADSPLRRSLEQIETAAQQAAELTSQMLAYSGRSRFVFSSQELTELVGGLREEFHMAAPAGADLRFELGEELGTVEADSTQVAQMLRTLVTNGFEALDGRPGTVCVSTETVEVDGREPVGDYAGEPPAPGRYTAVSVSDTGCGIDRETLQRMFDPFFSTKFPGRGMGLAALLGIMRSHRGAVEVHTRPGQGTTMRLLFPVVHATPMRAPMESLVSAGPSGGRTVLVVDDEDVVRDIVRRILTNAGYHVLTVAGGEEAIELFRDRPGTIDLMLLDLTMPNMDGHEVLQELRADYPGLRVILSSGYSEHEIRERFNEGELSGFIHKPYGSAELLEKVEAVLGPPRRPVQDDDPNDDTELTGITG